MIHPSVRFWYKHLSNISEKASIGEDSVIHSGVHIHDQVVIGRNCRIQTGAYLPNGATLGDDVFVGPNVTFTNDPTMQGSRYQFEPVPTIVKNGVKIGAGSILLAGITVGEFSVIGAGSIVTKDVPSGELWINRCESCGSPVHARFQRLA